MLAERPRLLFVLLFYANGHLLKYRHLRLEKLDDGRILAIT
jgi:hypothetical protein